MERKQTKIISVVTILSVFFFYFSSIAFARSNQSNELDVFNKNIHRLYQQGDYAKALSVAKEAVAYAEKNFGRKSLEAASFYSTLATIYSLNRQYQNSEVFRLKGLKIIEEAFGPNSPEVAVKLGSLGAHYYSQKKYDMAEEVLKRGLKILESNFGTDSTELLGLLNNLAVTEVAMGNSESAKKIFLRTVNLYKTHKIMNLDYAIALRSMANFYLDKNEFEKAESMLLEIINVYHKLEKKGHPDYADFLSELAVFFKNKKEYNLAENCYIDSFEIRARVFGYKHNLTQTAYAKLYKFFNDMGNKSKAAGLKNFMIEKGGFSNTP